MNYGLGGQSAGLMDRPESPTAFSGSRPRMNYGLGGQSAGLVDRPESRRTCTSSTLASGSARGKAGDALLETQGLAVWSWFRVGATRFASFFACVRGGRQSARLLGSLFKI